MFYNSSLQNLPFLQTYFLFLHSIFLPSLINALVVGLKMRKYLKQAHLNRVLFTNFLIFKDYVFT